MKAKARATMHGAISIVNAIATGYGSALGVCLEVMSEVAISDGYGIRFHGGRPDRLVSNIVKNVIPKNILENSLVNVQIKSEIPARFGLKSSSAVSNAISLACHRLVQENIDDYAVLDAAVRASLDAKVSITGAYDDASACYFGGFVVTDNYGRKLLRREEAPMNLYAAIFLPKNRQRGDLNRLKEMAEFFTDAFALANSGDYWKAMKLNGIAASAALSADYKPALAALTNGAISASLSGNGPSVAAVSRHEKIQEVKSAMAKFSGRVIVCRLSNEKASVSLIDG
jgi:shikimate kinase